MTLVAMLLAGAAGALLRYELSGWFQSRTGSALPLGTGLVNVLGTILFAVLIALHQTGGVSSQVLFVLGVGFCGAFTTFSTWMMETSQVLEKGGSRRFMVAGVNLVEQLAVAVLVAWVLLTILS